MPRNLAALAAALVLPLAACGPSSGPEACQVSTENMTGEYSHTVVTTYADRDSGTVRTCTRVTFYNPDPAVPPSETYSCKDATGEAFPVACDPCLPGFQPAGCEAAH